MERRERYDPEDIENLLAERSFDELLEEERAFVLRHMNGREEYDRMRSLLHYMRPDERSHTQIEPEDRVRTNVMNAFRAQQTPQWRVWLNSVLAWLTPSETSDLWRPALAFGTLALLVVVGVFTVRNIGGPEHGGLAEVRRTENSTPTVAPAPVDRSGNEAAGSSTVVTGEELEVAESEAHVETIVSPDLLPAMNSSTNAKDMALVEKQQVSKLELADAEFTFDASDEDLALEEVVESEKKESVSAGHVVTEVELISNMSLANTDVTGSKAAGSSRTKFSKTSDVAATASRNMGQDALLFGLLTAGW